MTFRAITIVHIQRTQRIPKFFERIPHIAGPMRNAIPKAAPMYPIFFALSSGAEISDIYACMTPNHAPPSHPIKRANRKILKPTMSDCGEIIPD